MRRFPHEVHLVILRFLGVICRSRVATENEEYEAAVASGCSVTSVSRICPPWLPRLPLDGHWLVPMHSTRVISVHSHRGEALHLRADGKLWARSCMHSEVTKVATSEFFILALLADGSATVWSNFETPAEPLPGKVLDIIAGVRSFLLLRETCASLYLQKGPICGTSFSRIDIKQSFISAIGYRRFSRDVEMNYALESLGHVYELVPPRSLQQRRLWHTPVGGCGAQQPLSSLGAWTQARRTSGGGGLRSLSCGYAHLGAKAGAVLSFPIILSAAPRSLVADFELGCVDVVCSTIDASAAHFHLLLFLFHADATCDVWTWCMQWQWLRQTRISMESLSIVVAPTRYVALHTSVEEWTIYDAARTHHDRQFATRRSAIQVAFARLGLSACDEYALIVLLGGVVRAEVSPNSLDSTERFVRDEFANFEGVCDRLKCAGERSVARISKDGHSCMQIREGSFNLESVFDVMFSHDGTTFLVQCIRA